MTTESSSTYSASSPKTDHRNQTGICHYARCQPSIRQRFSDAYQTRFHRNLFVISWQSYRHISSRDLIVTVREIITAVKISDEASTHNRLWNFYTTHGTFRLLFHDSGLEYFVYLSPLESYLTFSICMKNAP